MPPGKALQPVLKMKVDELFLHWLSEPGTQRTLHACLQRLQTPARAHQGEGDSGLARRPQPRQAPPQPPQAPLQPAKALQPPHAPPQPAKALQPPHAPLQPPQAPPQPAKALQPPQAPPQPAKILQPTQAPLQPPHAPPQPAKALQPPHAPLQPPQAPPQPAKALQPPQAPPQPAKILQPPQAPPQPAKILQPPQAPPQPAKAPQPPQAPLQPAKAPQPPQREHRGASSPGPPPAATQALGAAVSARSESHARGPRRAAGTRAIQRRREEPLPPATSQNIPTFYFPRGRPRDTVNVDAVITHIERTFADFPQERATMDDMGRVAKACGCPLYWKGPLFYGAGGERTGSVSVHKFIAMWRKVLHSCHDDAAKFVHLLMSPGCDYLVQEDFVPFLQDVVNTHPGLSFLKEASEFHSRYITTVIQRIFYTVNRSWSGRITCAELRRSTFLQNVALLEEEADINQLTEFFSYEHFYVIYCKFWELDTDHDLLIDAEDLARHNDHAISTRMIERIFSGAVTRGKKVQKEGKISYADFVWFLISEEDKKTPTSIEYWFRCMDLDGDGALSMFELEHFYEEQCRRLDSMAIEALPFEDCLCQMLDLVKPQDEGRITLHDLKKCKLAGVFFDTFFNIEKYLDHEQKEQISLLRDSDSEGPELSDWEKYAAEEYDILVAEEAAGEAWDDGYEAELSPVEQKLSSLRPSLTQRPFFESPCPLGDVELYESESEEEEEEEEEEEDLRPS